MRIAVKGPLTSPSDIRQQDTLLQSKGIKSKFDGKALHVMPEESLDRGNTGAGLVAHLRGRGDVVMSTDAIMELTRGS